MNKTSAPILQQQELTWKCNNNCIFCYNPERCIESFTPRAVDRERNIAVAEASVAHGVMAVCPTGGEPLVVGDHFFEVLSIYHRAGCYTSINSNGRLITDVVARRLAQTGLRSALVSMHGLGELHDTMVGIRGAFQETWSGIMRLKEIGITVTPNFVATAKNIQGLKDVGEAFAMNGIVKMTVTPFLPSWGSDSHDGYILLREHYRIYFEAVRRIRGLGINIDSTLPIPPCVLIRLFPDEWCEYLDVHSPRVCMAGRSFGVVSPDGQFRACIQAPYFADYGGVVLENYAASWSRANDWARADLLPDVCRDCPALDICGGGCRTSCLWENKGTVKGRTMYMGDPLTEAQAIPFLARVACDVKPTAPTRYALRTDIKIRDEGWGVIIFNPRNQSFTILSSEAAQFMQFTTSLSITSEKTVAVLRAMHAIRPEDDTEHDGVTVLSSVLVLPGTLLLPRLARGLIREDTVYCLRADTGERYFF